MPHTPLQRWEDYEAEYRREWERDYPNVPWNDVSYGYRYGWEQARDPRYRGRSWGAEIEHELRLQWDDWEASHRLKTISHQLQQRWDDLKDSIRQGWERAMREIDML